LLGRYFYYFNIPINRNLEVYYDRERKNAETIALRC
jgi:hypothetical protein